MYAVLDTQGYDIPEVYIFNTYHEAVDFKAWMIDTNPQNDGTHEYRAEASDQIVITPVMVPPDHWNKVL